jgi:cyclohexanone monooxygenase
MRNPFRYFKTSPEIIRLAVMMAARFQDAGISDFRIIERAGDFDGTWYWNRYPGAQCDVESYIYLPLLNETGYMPKEKYSALSH